MTKEIPIGHGRVTVVDDSYYEMLIAMGKWHTNKSGKNLYATHTVNLGNGKFDQIIMHRVIMDAPDGQHVDHKDGNSLNNTRENLRFCSRHGNSGNARKRSDNTSGYRGVSWHKTHRRWVACIYIEGRNRTFPRFYSKKDAARAYDEAAKIVFGEFARLNFPEVANV